MRVEPAASRPCATPAAAGSGAPAQGVTGGAAREAAPSGDEAALSATARLHLTAQRAAGAALRDRAQQVQALRESVTSGQYQVAPDALCEALTAVLTQGGQSR
jgi:hypothetical protein